MPVSIRLLVILGCGLRLFHFLRNPSVWHDEAALIDNVLRLDFTQFWGPLRWNEAAPPLFLALERAIVLTLGDSTLSVRLAPLIAGCLALWLFAGAACRLISHRGAALAVLLLVVSDRLIWHSIEAKSYSVDVLINSGLLWALAGTSTWHMTRRLGILIAICPFLMFVSYPACFMCGAAWIALAHGARREGRAAFAMLIVLAGVILVSFALLYFGPIHAQRTGPMEECWSGHFPDWSRPWKAPIWTVANTFEVFRYGFMPWGNLLLPVAVAGSAALWRSARQTVTWMAAAPLVLAWLAGLMHGYPYGGSRLEIFAAPGLALLIGSGIEPACEFLRRRSRLAPELLFVPVLASLALTARFAVTPWPRADAAGAADYILAHRLPGDGIAANHWEFLYYFRRCGNDWQLLDHGFPENKERVWIAFVAPDDSIRNSAIEGLTLSGRVLQRREFKFTSVVLLDRSAPCDEHCARSEPQHSLP